MSYAKTSITICSMDFNNHLTIGSLWVQIVEVMRTSTRNLNKPINQSIIQHGIGKRLLGPTSRFYPRSLAHCDAREGRQSTRISMNPTEEETHQVILFALPHQGMIMKRLLGPTSRFYPHPLAHCDAREGRQCTKISMNTTKEKMHITILCFASSRHDQEKIAGSNIQVLSPSSHSLWCKGGKAPH